LLVLLAAGVAAGTVGVVTAWAGFPNILDFGEPTIVYGGDPSATTLRTTSSGGGGGDFGDPRVSIDDVHVVDVDYSSVVLALNGRFDAEYVCVKRGRVAKAVKLTLVDRVKATAEIPADANGEAFGSILSGPLPSGAEAAESTGFKCPKGHTLEFDRASFSELVLSAQGGQKVKLHLTLVSESVHGLD
jgi:hypothetical protein